jgi:hypothetical protein
MFKHPDGISDTLNKGIQLYIDRLDLDKRNRELFFDIIRFVFDEGKIAGKEEYLREHREFTNQINKDDDKEQN